MTTLAGIICGTIGLLCGPSLGAQPALSAFQGGTGTTSPSGILIGDSTIRLKTLGIGANLSFDGTTLSATGGGGGSGTVGTSSIPSVGSLAYWTSAGFPSLLGSIATTTVTATSPLALSNTVWKVGGSNAVLSLDTSGTWSGNAGTASALAANGANCTAGSYPLGVDASGAVETCTVDTAFSTTSANVWSGFGLGFSTTSANLWASLGLAFSTTSSNAWSALGLGFSTTSVNYWESTQSARGGGGSGGGTWATTTSQTAGTLINYPLNATDVVTIGSNSTTTAEWWFDPALLSMNVGTGGAGDSTLTFGPNTSNQWMMGWDDTDKSFAIASSTALGTLNALKIDKGGLLTMTYASSTGFSSSYASSTLFHGKWMSNQSTQGLTLTESGGDLLLTADVAGVDSFFISTAGTFFEMVANPGPGNGYEMITFEETQGDDTYINIYEGGAGHNRFWNSGSTRLGGLKGYLCSNLTNQVDCIAGADGLGADLVLADDFWLGGKIIATSTTETSTFERFFATNATTTNATSTNFDITNLLTFGGVTGNSWDDFCTTITGGSGLCDGTDATGSGGGLATSTAIADTYVIYGTSAADVGAEAAFTYDDATNHLTVSGTTTTTNLSVTTAVSILGEYFTNFTTYVRSLFTGGTGIAISSGDITFDCSEVEGTGINCTGESITLDATGDWTGTFDGIQGSAYLANSFSTTSANVWSGFGLGFSTTSADVWGASKGYSTFGYPFPAAATSTLLTFSGGITASAGTVNLSAATVKVHTYASFTYSTSTSWTSSTTIPLGPAYTAEAWNGAKCTTDTGTLFVQFSDGTNNMNDFQASTTVGTVTLSSNNSFTASEKRQVVIGTPASSPTKISCTLDKTVNN